MTLSLEGLPLLIIFLLPGFFVFYTRRSLNPAVTHTLDNFELGLLSLGYGTSISIFEALVYSYVLSVFGINVVDLVNKPIAVFTKAPLLTMTLIFVWVILGNLLALGVGVWDPYHSLLKRMNERARQLDTDIWYNLLELKRGQWAKNATVVITTRMRNGDTYFGYGEQFGTTSDDSGHRDLILYKVTHVKGREAEQDTDLKYLGDNSYVLLNTRDIDAIELVIEETASAE